MLFPELIRIEQLPNFPPHQPFYVSLLLIEGELEMHWLALGEWGYGRTITEALLSLCQSIRDYYALLLSESKSLTNEDIEDLRLLQDYFPDVNRVLWPDGPFPKEIANG